MMSVSTYSARLRTPFAVLGIRTGAGAVTGIEYLSLRERAQAPVDAIAERACRQLERYLADPHWRFTLPLAPAGTATLTPEPPMMFPLPSRLNTLTLELV